MPRRSNPRVFTNLLMKIAVLSRVNHWWGDLPLRWKGATVLLIPVTALICGFMAVNHWWGGLPLGLKGGTVFLIPGTALICGFTSVYLVWFKKNAAEAW